MAIGLRFAISVPGASGSGEPIGVRVAIFAARAASKDGVVPASVPGTSPSSVCSSVRGGKRVCRRLRI